MPSRREVWANATTGSAMRSSADRTTNFEIQRDDIASSLLRLRWVELPIPRCRKCKPIEWLVHHNAVFAGSPPPFRSRLRSADDFETPSLHGRGREKARTTLLGSARILANVR